MSWVEEKRREEKMEEEEHEVYGGEIPDVEGDHDHDNPDVDMSAADDDAAAVKELDEMKRRLKEMEEEAAALREMQAKVEKEIGSVQGSFIHIFSFDFLTAIYHSYHNRDLSYADREILHLWENVKLCSIELQFSRSSAYDI